MRSILKVSIRQIKAARALLDWSQTDLAMHSGISEPTIKRLESADGALGGRPETAEAIRAALEAAGVEFIAENGGGPGVRMRKLAVGDKVRIRHGTSFWGQHYDLKDAVGTVTAIVDDGTSVHRVTVEFPGETFEGMVAGTFELALPRENSA